LFEANADKVHHNGDENPSEDGETGLEDPQDFLKGLKAEMALDKGDGEPVNSDLAELIKAVFLEKSADNVEITAIIKKNAVPQNLPELRTPKLNPELANNKKFVKN
jgi:hypothetical protein